MTIKLASTYVPAPSTTRGQNIHIYSDPKTGRIAYPNGKNIIIRDLENPSQTFVYSGHTVQTTVAAFSPSGFYVASGDVNGNVRIWDTVGEDHILKSTFRPLSGPIRDLQWDSDNQRILAVGEGKERFGHVFTFDSGNSVGIIDGHSKVINGCSIRHKRPFRAATCSDDFTVVFFQGTPYKFIKTIRDHSAFVNDVKFSPDGSYFVSVGSDYKIFLYDGATGDLISQISDAKDGHKGTIYAVSWSPDSNHIMTSSADKSVKIWNIQTKTLERTINISKNTSNGPLDMQLGNVWTKNGLVSLSLSGDLNVLDLNSDSPISVYKSHQKSILASLIASSDKIYTGSYDGRIYILQRISKLKKIPQKQN
ncbi:putative WD repeat-containing protein [Smittium culicis]|uniref:Putative WD repeat-containing protein n=1 Tax=Smittium culicis TaxID=133412 RepID=A0A1R1YS83_9FUNG|nr:putative WD repeat-containing protein [Smittium culicis]